MVSSKQIYIFGTRSDLEPGLKQLETDIRVKYVRCDLYHGPTFEQHLSLLDWDGLGRNPTGDHTTGTRFLVVKRDCKVKVMEIPQVADNVRSLAGLGSRKVLICNEAGAVSESPLSLDQYLSDLEQKSTGENKAENGPTLMTSGNFRYDVGPDQNPDSVIIAPGGIYNDQRVLVCGHIGAGSNSPEARSLCKGFAGAITKGFEYIGSYRVGPEAVRLMDEGYRLVTISLASPREYDLRR
jgi:hypothetical protein